ncbi:MAG: hypothetical protein HY319_18345 [Armatimonadetes bacterium]|nr:hypothetical protein [Armatimonadota bacterium]
MISNLDEFLEIERRRGELQSSGTFTLSLERALEKLRHYQLAHPAFYILKLIQSAIAAGARRVDVRLRRDGARVDFGLTEPGWYGSLRLILEKLQGPITAAPSALEHLLIALQSSQAIEGARTCFTHACAERWERVELSAGHVELERTFQPPRNQVVPGQSRFSFELRRPFTVSFLRSLWSRTHEYSAILAHCRLSPVPIFLDGRPLEPHLWKGDDDVLVGIVELSPRRRIDPGFRLDPGTHQAIQGLGLRTPGTHSGPLFLGVREPDGAYRAPRAEDSKQLLRAAVLVRVGSEQQPDSFQFVKSGIALAPRPLDLGIPGQAHGFCSAEMLKTDLSGLQVVEDEAFGRELERLRSMTRRFVYYANSNMQGLEKAWAGDLAALTRARRWLTECCTEMRF